MIMNSDEEEIEFEEDEKVRVVNKDDASLLTKIMRMKKKKKRPR